MRPSRRDVMKAGLAAGATLAGASAFSKSEPMQARPFTLNYAPHFGMFGDSAGNDPVDQLKFAADQGFRAWEDNGMRGRSKDEQERIAKAMTQLGIQMGVFVANDIDWSNPTITTGSKDHLDRFVQNCKDSVEVAKRVNAKWMTVVPGTYQHRLDVGFQTANVIEALRRGAEIFEPHGLVMVLEPLNFRDHPSLFLNKIPQAFMICRAVNSPSCKILFDMYHQQIHEGNIIPNIDAAWSEVAYFQVGDNPGRQEPTTGEMNYGNIFRHIQRKGFKGILGMEHGVSRGGKDGEQKLIEAYRSVDPS